MKNQWFITRLRHTQAQRLHGSRLEHLDTLVPDARACAQRLDTAFRKFAFHLVRADAMARRERFLQHNLIDGRRGLEAEFDHVSLAFRFAQRIRETLLDHFGDPLVGGDVTVGHNYILFTNPKTTRLLIPRCNLLS